MTRFSPLFAEWADLVAADGPVSGEDLADTLLRACDGLSDEVLRALPASPDGAAAALTSDRFADRVDGVYLPIEWLEAFFAGIRLPLAEIGFRWDILHGGDVYLF